MLEWLIPVVVYVVGYVICWRKEAGRIAYKEAGEWGHETPDLGNVSMGFSVALVTSMIWPILWVVRICYAKLGNDPQALLRKVAVEPDNERMRRLEREAEERERYVKNLERQLDVK